MKTLTKKELQIYYAGNTCTLVTTSDAALFGVLGVAVPPFALAAAIGGGLFAIFGAAFCDSSPLTSIPPDTHSNNHTQGPR